MSSVPPGGMVLTEAACEGVRRHGEEAYPRECCGFLLGRTADGGRIATRIRRAVNERADAPRTRYLIPPEVYLRAVREADAEGVEVLGFYHSHPEGKARPSEHDRAHALPGCSYVILEVTAGWAGVMSSWRLNRDRSAFDPEPLAGAGRADPRGARRVTRKQNRRTD